MFIFYKFIIGLILSISLIVSIARPAVKLMFSINAGHYLALPESMAHTCANTIKRQHARRIKTAKEMPVDPAIKQQIIEFEQASFEDDLLKYCDIADLSRLPDKDTLTEIKP